MSEMHTSLTLQRELHQGYPFFVPGIGTTYTDQEIITAIGCENGPALPLMGSFALRQAMTVTYLPPRTLTFPSEMAARILTFCKTAFVDVEGNFNCHTFLGYAMGWKTEMNLDTPHRYAAIRMNNQETLPNQPYFIESPQILGDPISHMLLSTVHQEYALNVLGTRQPLALSPISNLMRMYGGETLHHIVEYLPPVQ